jgi:hypothetical protein
MVTETKPPHLVLRCSEHPTYQALKLPRAACPICAQLYYGEKLVEK